MERNESFFQVEFYNYQSLYAQVKPTLPPEEDDFYDIILDGGEVTQ